MAKRRHQKRSFWPKQAEAEHQKRSFWRSRGRGRNRPKSMISAMVAAILDFKSEAFGTKMKAEGGLKSEAFGRSRASKAKLLARPGPAKAKQKRSFWSRAKRPKASKAKLLAEGRGEAGAEAKLRCRFRRSRPVSKKSLENGPKSSILGRF